MEKGRARYLEQLSTNLESAGKTKIFADVEVSVEGKSYQCHRVVLGMMSRYFLDLLKDATGSVEVYDIDSVTFEEVLRYIYTGDCSMTQANADKLLKAAIKLQVNSLRQSCEEFLADDLSADTCLATLSLAKSLNCSDLESKTWNYVLEAFPSVSKMNSFKQVDVDTLISIFSNDNLNSVSEETVCDAALKWIEFDPNTRTQFLDKIVGCLRLPLVGAEYLVNFSQKDVVKQNGNCQAILKAASEFIQKGHTQADMSLLKPDQLRYRQEETICVVGARSRHPNPQTTEIKCFSFRRGAEFVLSPLPEEPGACCAVCENNNDVFVSGGYYGQTLLLRYESAKNQWKLCEPLQEGRWGHCMVSLNGSLYVLGGSTKTSETISSVERYDPDQNWSDNIGNLCIPVSFSVAAAQDDKIYLFGGKLQDHTVCSQIQCYNTKTNECSVVGTLPLVSSSLARAIDFGQSIYVFYGHGTIVEYKEGLANVVGSMPRFDYFGLVKHDGKILIDGCESNSFSMMVFNPATREVTTYTIPVKAALCNFHCMKIVVSEEHLKHN